MSVTLLLVGFGVLLVISLFPLLINDKQRRDFVKAVHHKKSNSDIVEDVFCSHSYLVSSRIKSKHPDYGNISTVSYKLSSPVVFVVGTIDLSVGGASCRRVYSNVVEVNVLSCYGDSELEFVSVSGFKESLVLLDGVLELCSFKIV